MGSTSHGYAVLIPELTFVLEKIRFINAYVINVQSSLNINVRLGKPNKMYILLKMYVRSLKSLHSLLTPRPNGSLFSCHWSDGIKKPRDPCRVPRSQIDYDGLSATYLFLGQNNFTECCVRSNCQYSCVY